MGKLLFDDEVIDPDALDWWKSLDPGIRSVYLQATWELEGCPEPRQKEPAKPRAPRKMPHDEWMRQVREICSNSVRGRGDSAKIAAKVLRLREMNPDEFDRIATQERTQAQDELRALGGMFDTRVRSS